MGVGSHGSAGQKGAAQKPTSEDILGPKKHQSVLSAHAAFTKSFKKRVPSRKLPCCSFEVTASASRVADSPFWASGAGVAGFSLVALLFWALLTCSHVQARSAIYTMAYKDRSRQGLLSGFEVNASPLWIPNL